MFFLKKDIPCKNEQIRFEANISKGLCILDCVFHITDFRNLFTLILLLFCVIYIISFSVKILGKDFSLTLEWLNVASSCSFNLSWSIASKGWTNILKRSDILVACFMFKMVSTNVYFL